MIKRLRVTVDGNTYDVTVEQPDEAGSSPAPGNNHTEPAPVAPAPVASPVAAVPMVPVAPVVVPASTANHGGTASAGDVPSPLAGRVTAVMITAGQDVKEGDHLVTLEAMKMNTFVFAPKSGKTAALLTEVGAAVEEGQILVKID